VVTGAAPPPRLLTWLWRDHLRHRWAALLAALLLM